MDECDEPEDGDYVLYEDHMEVVASLRAGLKVLQANHDALRPVANENAVLVLENRLLRAELEKSKEALCEHYSPEVCGCACNKAFS